MMQLIVIKCQGSDNDFILVDETKNPALSETERRAVAIIVCDRDHGIGADGVLFYQASPQADAKMRMFNPDGSEAEMCGNGIRCLGRYAMEQIGKSMARIETMKAVLEINQRINIYPGVYTYETTIEPVSLDPASLPLQLDGKPGGEPCVAQVLPDLSPTLTFTALSVPNPHIISFVTAIDDAELAAIGQQANANRSLFPRGVNVSFVKILAPQAIFVATYERGVGLTHACGTAMSASCFSACWQGFTPFDTWIDVYNKGGMVRCKAHQNASEPHLLYLAGNASFDFVATIALDFEQATMQSCSISSYFPMETARYAEFKQFCKAQWQPLA